MLRSLLHNATCILCTLSGCLAQQIRPHVNTFFVVLESHLGHATSLTTWSLLGMWFPLSEPFSLHRLSDVFNCDLKGPTIDYLPEFSTFLDILGFYQGIYPFPYNTSEIWGDGSRNPLLSLKAVWVAMQFLNSVSGELGEVDGSHLQKIEHFMIRHLY